MGHTWYWDVPGNMNVDKFKRVVSDAIKIASRLPPDIEIGEAMGRGGEPVFNNNMIAFNGVGPFGHESFYLPRVSNNLDIFDWFCKTAHKPYDLLVASVLCSLKHHFGEEVKISVDGDIPSLQKGYDFFVKVCEYDKVMPIESMLGYPAPASA